MFTVIQVFLHLNKGNKLTYEYSKLAPEYQSLWETMKIVRDAAELNRLATKIKQYQAVYQKVQDEVGVPWQMVAVIHVREAGETDIGQWKRVLHNGERIIGLGRKTKLVPAGRGPFKTWHEAAIDALKLKGFDKIKSWPVARVLYSLEPYNGYGYRQMGLRSPYLWASTNHQQKGKYVADRVFDANVMDSQIGCAALLKFLDFGKPTTSIATAAATVVVGAGATVYTYADNPWVFYPGICVAAICAVVASYKLYQYYKGNKTNVG
jgi:lysozyme family protein